MRLTKNSIILVVITSIASCTTTYLACKTSFDHSHRDSTETIESKPSATSNSCEYNVSRLSGYQYIKPLLFAEPLCESQEFASLKSQVAQSIQQNAGAGNILTASVYVRDFDQGNWTVINPDETFHPGSLMKIPLLITFLRMEEKNPGFLNRKILIDKIDKPIPHQTFTSREIVKGNSYTIRELLEYMISYSDNTATWALHKLVDLEEYQRTYRYINVSAPDFKSSDYALSSKEFSILMKVLYNSGYLSNEHSEFAVELLSRCDFKQGFKSGFPSGTTIAEKFGEWGDGKAVHELHESGFVYLNGKAYLITVMSRGNEVSKLSNFISSISRVIYDNLVKN